MNFELFVAFRYLLAKRKQTFISLITLLSMAGVALGVCALVVVLSVMEGFETELKSKLLSLNAHIMITKSGDNMNDFQKIIKIIQNNPKVVVATPYIYGQVMLVASGSGASGIIIRGLDLSGESKAIELENSIIQGNLQELIKSNHTNELPGIIIGSGLAHRLGLVRGSNIQLINPLGEETPAGRAPKSEAFKVVGIFETGMYQYDTTLCYVTLQMGQNFLNLGQAVNGIEIKVRDIYQATEIGEQIAKTLGPTYFVRDWMIMNHNLFAALKLEKITMFVILILIVLVAAFGIISSLIMLVMEKARDIGILKAMGSTEAKIRHIFMLEGTIIGTIGTIIGLSLSLMLCWFLGKYKFIKLPKDIYFMNTLPVQIEIPTLLLVGCLTILISILATIYPAYIAGRLDPVEALRYE